MKIISFFIIFLLAFSSGVFAVGGGGGGGGGGGSSSSSGGGGGGGGSGNFFDRPNCDTTGTLIVKRSPRLETIIIEDSEGNNFSIQGDWVSTIFISEEAEVITAGDYVIRDIRFGDQKFTCPGLTFSCRTVNLSLTSCILGTETLEVNFQLTGKGTAPSDLDFEFKGAKKYYYGRNSYSKEVKNISFTSSSLIIQNAPSINLVQVVYPGCVGRYYVYSQIACTPEEQQPQQETPGKILKCGGYLDIEDRVTCRIGLREDEEYEYENFFPEECKSRSDQEVCLGVYQAVQTCWQFPHGPKRIACVKEKLDLKDIQSEKQACETGDAKDECNALLKRKVYDLIKFRLYDLEEEAERLMEEDKLEKQQVIDFVVAMEKEKRAFNEAQSKEERRGVILRARQAWRDLVKKVKS